MYYRIDWLNWDRCVGASRVESDPVELGLRGRRNKLGLVRSFSSSQPTKGLYCNCRTIKGFKKAWSFLLNCLTQGPFLFFPPLTLSPPRLRGGDPFLLWVKPGYLVRPIAAYLCQCLLLLDVSAPSMHRTRSRSMAIHISRLDARRETDKLRRPGFLFSNCLFSSNIRLFLNLSPWTAAPHTGAPATTRYLHD